MTTFLLEPGSVASLLYLHRVGSTAPPVACVFSSFERGVLVGNSEKPMADLGWPLEVQAQINKHFGTVFSLEHETWKGRGPSPRAQYVDAATPWEVTVSE